MWREGGVTVGRSVPTDVIQTPAAVTHAEFSNHLDTETISCCNKGVYRETVACRRAGLPHHKIL